MDDQQLGGEVDGWAGVLKFGSKEFAIHEYSDDDARRRWCYVR
jgi:hypothetical protein